MHFMETTAGKFHFRLEGPEDAPVIVLSNSLGTNLAMWDAQAAAFAHKFRVLRYDTRGHGLSVVTEGPYSIDQLGGDVLTLLDSLKIHSAVFCGISLGGITGMWLGVHAPQRLNALILCNTAGRIGTAEGWNARIAKIRESGMESVAQAVVGRWFTPRFIAHSPEKVEAAKQMLTTTPVEGYAACCAAIREADLRPSLAKVGVPALVIAGTHDGVTTPADAAFLVKNIPGARGANIGAAHLSNIEAPANFNKSVLRFLTAREAR
ncbi:MAG: 3-oxoadipate enol-lactonase [Candidatus Acidiferrales bacterium]